MAVVKKMGHGKSKPSETKAADEPTSRRKDVEVSLPTKANVPPGNLEDYVTFIFGEKGIGKTSLAAQWKNMLTAMFEPRRRNLSIIQIPKPGEPPLDYSRTRAYFRAAIKSKSFNGVNVDTVDRLYEVCLKHVCEAKGIKHPSQIKNDYGGTWHEVKQTFEELLNELLYADMSLVLTSHARKREVNNKLGRAAYDLITPTCSDAPWTTCKAIVDLVIYYHYTDDGQRAMTIRGDDMVWSAQGLQGRFMDPDGNPVKTLLGADSPEECFDILKKSFNNKVYGLEVYEETEDEETEETEEEVELPEEKPARRKR